MESNNPVEISNEFISQKLEEAFGNEILFSEVQYGILTLVINPASIHDIASWLYDHEKLRFRFLTDICGNHFPHLKDSELCAVYHLQSMENNLRLRIKCHVSLSHPNVPSLTSLYASANWMERETYDFYGIIFEGHPDLRRILNVDEMDYFPLRKEYPLEDGTRTDKEDQYFGR